MIQTALWLCLIAALLFLGAGDWSWPQAWLFLAETALSSSALIVALARHDPDLLRERAGAPWHLDRHGWDRLFLAVLCAAPLLTTALAVRILGEERMLNRALPGYAAYAAKVRARLIPGVW